MRHRTSLETANTGQGIMNSQEQNSRGRDEEGRLQLLPSYLSWLFSLVPVTIDPENDARKFLSDYELKYSSSRPNFFEGSYQGAVAEAYKESKLLLAYLHSSLHEDTNFFCRETLSAPDLVKECTDGFVCWAGDIFGTEGYTLQHQLSVTKFPCIALFMCKSPKSVVLIEKVEGASDSSTLLNTIASKRAMHSMELEMRRQEELQRYCHQVKCIFVTFE